MADVLTEEVKRTLSIILPDPMYRRVVKLSKNPRFRTRNQVIMECIRRAIEGVERDFPAGEHMYR